MLITFTLTISEFKAVDFKAAININIVLNRFQHFCLFWKILLIILFFQLHAFFYKQRFFSTFLRIELQILLKCCLIHLTIIILRHILYLAYLCLWLGLYLFMSYLYDLLYIFSLIFFVITHLTPI